MKHKQRIEVKCQKEVDLFKAMAIVKAMAGVKSVLLIDVNTLVIYFDDRTIQGQEIIKAIKRPATITV